VDEYSANMVLSSETSAEIAKKYKFFHLMTRQKMFVYLQAVKNVSEYEKTKKKYERGLANLKQLEKEKQELEKKYSRQKDTKQKLLSTVSKKRTFYEQELAKLKESKEMLSKLIQTIEKKMQASMTRREEKKVVALKTTKKIGSLPWPLDGQPPELKKSVSEAFGKHKHPELDTWIINNGIRIKSLLGQNVLSVDKGTVVYAGDFKSYGNVIIIDHSGGFYTVYGNLEKILVKNDQVVERSAKIGLVGISVLTQDASLYFELRRDGAPQDPMKWLK
jgi:septal ring factor EnvC (AmiA/AmiB activator)